MARRNTRQRQPSPPSEEQSEGSQNAPVPSTSNPASRTNRARRHASQPGVGEEIDIVLSDENPSVPNSQTAPAVPPTSNSQLARAPGSSQGGSRPRFQQTSQDVKHFFRKTKGMPTICTSCE
jgi:hypothetical protein